MANNKLLIHQYCKSKVYVILPQTKGRQPGDTWTYPEWRRIEQVDSFNILGVIIDKHVSWKCHIEMLSNKTSKHCGELSRLKNYLPLVILTTLNFSMVHSYLSYRLLTWSFDSNRAVKLQKRCVRIITKTQQTQGSTHGYNIRQRNMLTLIH